MKITKKEKETLHNKWKKDLKKGIQLDIKKISFSLLCLVILALPIMLFSYTVVALWVWWVFTWLLFNILPNEAITITMQTNLQVSALFNLIYTYIIYKSSIYWAKRCIGIYRKSKLSID